MNIVILAGGSGSRLWPLSRARQPKQFTPLLDERTLLEDTVARFSDFPREKIFFSTIPDFADKIKTIFPNHPPENILVEPEKRDSFPAMAYVAAKLNLVNPEEPLAFIPSDHQIDHLDKFIQTIKVADQLIRETGKMLDIAIKPTFPSTNLGYTKIGARQESRDGVAVYQFAGHVEKPDHQTAEKYLQSGLYLWHANYYMWTPGKFLTAIKKYAPKEYEILTQISAGLKKNQDVSPQYHQLDKISFDYAITEKIDPAEVLILEGDFGWSDLGAWDVLYDQLSATQDEDGNVSRGPTLSLGTKNCLLFNTRPQLLATIGLEDFIVVATTDALLVCPKDRSQEVKQLVEEIKARPQLKKYQ